MFVKVANSSMWLQYLKTFGKLRQQTWTQRTTAHSKFTISFSMAFKQTSSRPYKDCSTEVRVALIGCKGVGKSSIARRYVRGEFREEHSEPAGEMYRRRAGDVVVEITETTGDDLVSFDIALYHVFVLVYAVDDEHSFDYTSVLREKIIARCQENSPIFVAGNKSDLTERKVHSITADCIVTMNWESNHFEVSARTGHNISFLFEEILHTQQSETSQSQQPILQDVHRRSVSFSTLDRAPRSKSGPSEIGRLKNTEEIADRNSNKQRSIKSRIVRFLWPRKETK